MLAAYATPKPTSTTTATNNAMSSFAIFVSAPPLLGGTLHFPSTMLRSKDKTDHLLFQEVAGCATGCARLSQAPNFMESGFKASTYWVVSLVLYNYMSIPKMPSGYSRLRLAERAKIVRLCNALVYTG